MLTSRCSIRQFPRQFHTGVIIQWVAYTSVENDCSHERSSQLHHPSIPSYIRTAHWLRRERRLGDAQSWLTTRKANVFLLAAPFPIVARNKLPPQFVKKKKKNEKKSHSQSGELRSHSIFHPSRLLIFLLPHLEHLEKRRTIHVVGTLHILMCMHAHRQTYVYNEHKESRIDDANFT